MVYVLDAHSLQWFLEDNPKLGNRADQIISDTGALLVLPAIALAEIARVVSRGKSQIPDVQELFSALRQDARIRVAPLLQEHVERAQESDFDAITEMHDQLIVATALSLIEAGEDVALITDDAVIVASGLVPTVW